MLTVIIKNPQGAIVGRFTATSTTNFVDQADEYGIAMPFSCHAGACMTCLCEVESGQEGINRTAEGEEFVPVEDNEILSCISAPLQEWIDSPDDNEIVLISRGM